MKVKFVREIQQHSVEYEALEDGTITTDCGDHPTFGIAALKDMKIFVKKGSHFTLLKEYIPKNNFDIEEEDGCV